AGGARPDPVLGVQPVEPLGLVAVARVADEPERLRERLRAEEPRIRLHRVALGDATAAVDAERFLADGVHALLLDPVLPAIRRLFVPRPEERIDGPELLPERIHVDNEVLD